MKNITKVVSIIIGLFTFSIISLSNLNGQLNIDCVNSYTLSDSSYSEAVTVSVSDSILSQAQHNNNTTVSYTAGSHIVCIDGFKIEMGTSFTASIADCLTESNACDNATMHLAFSEFDTDNFTITASSGQVTLLTNGLPNHTSPYWSNTTARSATMGNMTLTTPAASSNHALFVEPTVTSYAEMAPGNIDDFSGSYSLTVDESPNVATSSTATGLGAIGFSISGSVIYNDEEGPNVPLDNAVGSLDYSGAHTGPQSYHYHLETKAWSEDDDKLIGIIADGFFLYGRKCNSTGTYPTDLDASGGHTSVTQHTCDGAEYHYHIQNDLYLNLYYILFPGDYQGTPNAI